MLLLLGCSESTQQPPPVIPLFPDCSKPPSSRVDAHTPTVMVSDWGPPVRLGSPINTSCPEDAIEISRDGATLYFLFTEDILDSLTPAQFLDLPNGTYSAHRKGGPGDFNVPTYYDLGLGTEASLDGEVSFSPDGAQVYFHSNRAENLGYQANPSTDDFLDIYMADLVGGIPGQGVNLGMPVNSVYPDGEHALHPDGVSLYFSSYRPGGLGDADIWVSMRVGTVWSDPVNLGAPVNSFAYDIQPAFTSDGDTLYFMSDRNPLIGAAIYRSNRVGSGWSSPELVITGIVGEPSLTGNGQVMYFVHVLSDAAGVFDADIWYTTRTR
jgi:Tol biopolymer transport system component